jgi:ribosomal protein L7/L12
MTIPKEHEPQVLQSGIHFMRSITEAYGSEEGMRLWDAIASTLDHDIKAKIFVALLTGEFNDQLTIQMDMVRYQAVVNRVEGIKAIRMATGLGLKEAKDIHDNLADGKVEKITIDPAIRTQTIGYLASVFIMAH